ncbi:MAG: hypothetical protein M1831_004018 [Alyxoria varia]|nr:MAG: hypothetical protein M1831_004018 [Alyxoria varia]
MSLIGLASMTALTRAPRLLRPLISSIIMIIISSTNNSVICADGDTENPDMKRPPLLQSGGKATQVSFPTITLDSLDAENFTFEGELWGFVPPGECRPSKNKGMNLLCDTDKDGDDTGDAEEASGGSKKRMMQKRWPTPQVEESRGDENGSELYHSVDSDSNATDDDDIPETPPPPPWANIQEPGEKLRAQYLARDMERPRSSLFEIAPIRPNAPANDPARNRLDYSRRAFAYIKTGGNVPPDWDANVERLISSQYLGIYIHYVLPPALIYASFEAEVYRNELLKGTLSRSIPERFNSVLKGWRAVAVRGILAESLYEAPPRIAQLRDQLILFDIDYSTALLSWQTDVDERARERVQQQHQQHSRQQTDVGLVFEHNDPLGDEARVPGGALPSEKFPWAKSMTRREATAVLALLDEHVRRFDAIKGLLAHIMTGTAEQGESAFVWDRTANLPLVLDLEHVKAGFHTAAWQLKNAIMSRGDHFMPESRGERGI